MNSLRQEMINEIESKETLNTYDEQNIEIAKNGGYNFVNCPIYYKSLRESFKKLHEPLWGGGNCSRECEKCWKDVLGEA